MPTILMVDDVELFLELEKSLLEGSGYDIVTARSGEEALETLSDIDPDLMLLDLYMPGIDGDEVCRRLRQNDSWKNLPVIMVTAAGKEEEIRKCLDAGCDDYVTKPINKKELLDKVRRLLGEVKGRSEPRDRVALKVQLKVDGQNINAWAKDLSRNGIYVKSTTVLEEGSPVELSIDLGNGHSSPLLGKVKRVERGGETGMGIYFIHPDPLQLRELERASRRMAFPPSDILAEFQADDSELRKKNRQLLKRIEELETENREFAEQLIHSEDVNNNLTNLYVASSRLHSVLSREKVVEIIKEVVINFVGAEKFALLMLDKESKELRYETGEGFEGGFPLIPLGDSLLGNVAHKSESFFKEGTVSGGSDDPFAPLAAIPLKIHGQTMGVLAIYSLFIQKERFEKIDYQLFSMMAEHAATALFSSSLYEESERKRETYKGFMDLLLKQ